MGKLYHSKVAEKQACHPLVRVEVVLKGKLTPRVWIFGRLIGLGDYRGLEVDAVGGTGDILGEPGLWAVSVDRRLEPEHLSSGKRGACASAVGGDQATVGAGWAAELVV